MQTVKIGFCQGDSYRFSLEHRHYAQGYCRKTYDKMQYRAKHPRLPKMPRICKADSLPFDEDHKHYALGRCRYGYQRFKRGMIEGPYFCKTHNRSSFFPDEQAPKVLIQNGICQACSKILDLRKTT